uniref:(northern house mosquito) hypothetical protein n=1 Tax=Culex pipiens TaxID=7175 RepID=A0A8D8CZ21_CULPI
MLDWDLLCCLVLTWNSLYSFWVMKDCWAALLLIGKKMVSSDSDSTSSRSLRLMLLTRSGLSLFLMSIPESVLISMCCKDRHFCRPLSRSPISSGFPLTMSS